MNHSGIDDGEPGLLFKTALIVIDVLPQTLCGIKPCAGPSMSGIRTETTEPRP